MGLDMYMLQIKKPKTDFPDVITKDWLFNHQLQYIDESDIDEDENIQIKPYCITKDIQTELIDVKKIALDNGILINDDTCCSNTVISIKGYGFSFYNGDDTKYVMVPIGELLEKYTFTDMKKVYIFESKQISYWRKNYKLQDYIYEMFGNKIYNCGYQKLSEDEVRKILDFDIEMNYYPEEQLIKIEADNADNAYFYLEWY